MKRNNTRRGNTQKVVNKNGHSRMFLSGMTPQNNRHAEKSLLSICSALKTQGQDPEQKHFRMTLFDKGAFTLIELLVVVLIIGILAAVALPQYNKAVWKSRAVQTLLFMRNAGQALDRWVLENGAPKETVIFTGTKADGQLDLDLTEGMECDQWVCSNKNFSYSASWEQTYWYVSVGYQHSYDPAKGLGTGAYASEEKDANHPIFKSCTSFDVDGAKFCAALCSLDSGFC